MQHTPLSVQLLNVKIARHSWVYSLVSDKCIIKWMVPNEELEDVFVTHLILAGRARLRPVAGAGRRSVYYPVARDLVLH